VSRAKVSVSLNPFRGDVLVWVRLDGERVARCHLRDPRGSSGRCWKS
jgi:hypothetical protein